MVGGGLVGGGVVSGGMVGGGVIGGDVVLSQNPHHGDVVPTLLGVVGVCVLHSPVTVIVVLSWPPSHLYTIHMFISSSGVPGHSE